MAVERTFSIIKPDATKRNLTGAINAVIEKAGLRMTGHRRLVAQIIGEAADHPDVEELHRRAHRLDPKISLATVYRAVRLFEEAGILEKLDFGDGRARYEDANRAHHDHLIDLTTATRPLPH